MSDSLLHDLAYDILEELVTRLTNAGVSVPDRRYIHTGLVALDAGPGVTCADQLVVTLNFDFQGLPGLFDESPLQCEQPTTAVYEIWMSRCVPIIKDSGKPPSVDELNASAETIMEDVREISRAIYLGHFQKTLFPDRTCSLIRMGGGRIQGPQGGVTSYVMPIEVSLV